jgi:multidrug efflux pump subunit AcrB
MRKLILLFIDNPIYANILIGIIVIGGLMGLLNMNRSFFPEGKPRDITVSVFYPGASPKEMEEGITMRVEEALRSVVGIKEINSTSAENISRVRITTTGEYDLDETLMEVKNAVDGISSFPVDAERPVVFKQRSITFALFLGISGDVDRLTLKRFADQIENELYMSGIISQINVEGLPELEISVEISEANLLRYGLTFEEISRAIAANNVDLSAGLIRSESEEILIRSRSRTVDPNEIGSIILRGNPDGSYIYLRDVASIRKQFSELPQSSLMNGKTAITFRINKLPEEDLGQIAAFVRNYVEEFNEKHQNVRLEITYDFLNLLGGRLKLLYKNGGVGLLLVLLSLGLFLSFRLSVWVAWGIPASFLSMFILASMYGITINMISLFGMILVIGILVDDGIVIAENIYSHFEMGKSPRRAAIDGTMEVMPAVLTSITTTILAFSPLFFIEGRLQFMYEMAFVVVFSLLFSLVEAFLILPAHIGNPQVLRPLNRKSFGPRMRNKLDRAIIWMRDKIYGGTLRLFIRWKWIVASIPIGLIVITAGLFEGGQIRATFFPSIPFDQFNIDIAFTPGSGEGQTLQYLSQFDAAIWEVNAALKEEFGDTSDFIKYTFVNTGSAFNGQESGAHAGNIFVLLRDMEGAPVSSFDVVNRVRERIGPVKEAEKFTLAGRNTFGNPVAISLLGRDFDELEAAKAALISGMREIPAINNVLDNNAAGKREIQLTLKPTAYFLGLNQVAVASQVRQGFFGGQAQRLQDGKDELRVWVRYPREDREVLGQLENMKIKTQSGDYPLREIAEYQIKRGPVNIQRFNLSREVRVTADLVDPYEPVPPILEKIRQDILPDILTRYPGVRVEFQGQSRDSDETQSEMRKYFGLAFLLMFLVLLINFRSVTQAFLVIFMIPLAWLGSVWGHGIEGYPVSMLSAWGMVALSGVIINDAVVFLAKYNLFLSEGQTVKDAVYNAGKARFRAIVLTSITTVVGLYPLILETSFQAQFLIPMAISLAYGVLIGTAFILVFFPVIILIVNDIRVWLGWVWTGIRPAPEDMEVAVRNLRRAERIAEEEYNEEKTSRL